MSRPRPLVSIACTLLALSAILAPPAASAQRDTDRRRPAAPRQCLEAADQFVARHRRIRPEAPSVLTTDGRTFRRMKADDLRRYIVGKSLTLAPGSDYAAEVYYRTGLYQVMSGGLMTEACYKIAQDSICVMFRSLRASCHVYYIEPGGALLASYPRNKGTFVAMKITRAIASVE